MSDVAEQPLTLQLSRRFDATPERVFDAWLGEAWAAWLPPAGVTATLVAMDPRVGGRYEISMTMPDGRVIGIHGHYQEIDRPGRLVLNWIGNYNQQETMIALSFTRDGAGTLMTLTQTGFVSADLQDGYNRGWTGPGGSFDKLQALLAR